MTQQFSRRSFLRSTILATLTVANGGVLAGIVPKSAFEFTLNAYAFLAVGDGVADDTQKLQNLLNAAAGKIAYIQAGTYLTTSPLYVPSNTIVYGDGISTVIKNTNSEGFRNAGYPGATADSGIVIRDISFNGGGAGFTPINMIGVSDCTFERLNIKGMLDQNGNVNVGVAVAAKPSLPCARLRFNDLTINCPDYGIVLDSGASTYGLISDAIIKGCDITTGWGSCVSLARQVVNVEIAGNVFNIPGTDSVSTGVGIGVKIWDGYDATHAPNQITISGNTFNSSTTATTNVTGISTSNYSNTVAITGNNFVNCNYAWNNNTNQGTGFTFTGNTILNCQYGIGNTGGGTQGQMHVVNNTFDGITADAINIDLEWSSVTGNRFNNITGAAIVTNYGNESVFSDNTFNTIGKQAISIPTDGANNVGCIISNNVMYNCCQAVDNTYNVIQLNGQSHTVTGNRINNPSTTIKPTYIIGMTSTAVGSIFIGNWMYGARSGYYSTAPSGIDVNANNIQRGGIG